MRYTDAEILDAFDPGQVLSRPIDLAARAHDASHYLLTPKHAVRARTVDDVARAMRIAADSELSVTFRSGGTSLSGQSSGDGIQIDTRQGFRDIDVLDEGDRVRCGPGATIRSVNARLAGYGRKLGPDPASEVAATIGGVVANNSSGMACGTEFNTYSTIERLVLVLPSGTVVDTAAADADARLRHAEPALYQGLVDLKDRVRANPHSVARIRHLFSMKNTMGYGINAFLDYEDPVAILMHLIVGSEGTLGFIAQATLRTVPVQPEVATGLLVMSQLTHATDALESLRDAGAKTLELMDASSLRVIQPSLSPGDPLRSVQVRDHTALLVELQEPDAACLARTVARMESVTAHLPLDLPMTLTSDARERAALWTVRKGLYTAVAGARPPGTTALLEDIVVPVPALSATMTELSALLAADGYHDAVVFGHAKDGNLHFMINPRLAEPGELAVFEHFTEELVDLVLGHDGSLKAEHGTGRVMAPFVRRQYGDELYEVMVAVKNLCDPHRVLNPGVVLTDDPRAHLHHLKVVPDVDPAVDACVECGYCEPICPSKDAALTPRQRIAVMRTMAAGTPAQRAEIDRDFGYEAIDMCAADSLCVTACPVGIDTGLVMKGFRAQHAGGDDSAAQRAGDWAARHWAGVNSAARIGLTAAAAVPGQVLSASSTVARTVIPHELLPHVGKDLPGAGKKRQGGHRGAGAARAVFFPSCIGGVFAPERGGDGLLQGADAAFIELCARANVGLIVPEAIDGLCCGTVWQSKGLTRGHRTMAERAFTALWTASAQGTLPIVTDAASCTHGLRDIGTQLDEVGRANFTQLRFLDAVTFVRQEIVGQVPVNRMLASAAVHPTCSTVHLDIVEDLVAVAKVFAREVYVPTAWGCCGFAGDRGLLHPELTASATAVEVADLRAAESARCVDGDDGRFGAYASANRTCELGMSRATGRPYVHVLQLLERATR